MTSDSLRAPPATYSTPLRRCRVGHGLRGAIGTSGAKYARWLGIVELRRFSDGALRLFRLRIRNCGVENRLRPV